eukprot:7611405-Pyramimonas_sp.AAC.1
MKPWVCETMRKIVKAIQCYFRVFGAPQPGAADEPIAHRAQPRLRQPFYGRRRRIRRDRRASRPSVN